MPAFPRRNRIGWPVFRSVATAPNGILNFSIGRLLTERFTYVCTPSPFNTPLTLEKNGTDQSEIVASSISSASFCKAKPLLPAAYKAPTRLPALVPTTISGTMPCDSSALITPTCAKPRAAPPPSASAMRGFCGSLVGAATGVTGDVSTGAADLDGMRLLQAARRERESTATTRCKTDMFSRAENLSPNGRSHFSLNARPAQALIWKQSLVPAAAQHLVQRDAIALLSQAQRNQRLLRAVEGSLRHQRRKIAVDAVAIARIRQPVALLVGGSDLLLRIQTLVQRAALGQCIRHFFESGLNRLLIRCHVDIARDLRRIQAGPIAACIEQAAQAAAGRAATCGQADTREECCARRTDVGVCADQCVLRRQHIRTAQQHFRRQCRRRPQ